MSATRWFAVRCCCKPTTIFGFLQLLDDGRSFRTIVDRLGHDHKIELRASCETRDVASTDYYRNDPKPQPIVHRDIDLAVYSDDRPLEFWRQFDNFVEASKADDQRSIVKTGANFNASEYWRRRRP